MKEKVYTLTYRDTNLSPGDFVKNPDYRKAFGRYRLLGEYFVVTKAYVAHAWDETISDYPYQVSVVICRAATNEEIETARQADTL